MSSYIMDLMSSLPHKTQWTQHDNLKLVVQTVSKRIVCVWQVCISFPIFHFYLVVLQVNHLLCQCGLRSIHLFQPLQWRKQRLYEDLLFVFHINLTKHVLSGLSFHSPFHTEKSLFLPGSPPPALHFGGSTESNEPELSHLKSKLISDNRS